MPWRFWPNYDSNVEKVKEDQLTFISPEFIRKPMVIRWFQDE